jgi:dipeptidyl aminopeptidase/acylaminoacyl peptidase
VNGYTRIRSPLDVDYPARCEQALSARRHIDNIHTPLVLAHGTPETPEFRRQTRDFAAALKQARPADCRRGLQPL